MREAAAYTELSTNENLKGSFNKKKVAAMNDFREIVNGTKDRFALREYGDKKNDTRKKGEY